MLFNSLSFLVFLPIVVGIYSFPNHRWQNHLLLATSLFFYACWDWRFVFLLLLTVVVDFFVACSIESMQKRGAPAGRRKLVLAEMPAGPEFFADMDSRFKAAPPPDVVAIGARAKGGFAPAAVYA